MMTEFEQKQQIITDLLAKHGLNALVLRRVSSFAWATSGAASYVNTAAGEGEATLVVTPAGRFVVANNIEAPRLEQEERLSEQGWEFRVTPWHEVHDVVGDLTRGLKVGADVPLAGATSLAAQLARLRSILLPGEQTRFRTLAAAQAEAMDRAIRAVRPGQTEHEIAALLACETERRGIQCIVNLIATDERIFTFRHPLPTGKKLERYAMLVQCGRQRGLVCSCTRLVHFGRLPDDIRRKSEAVAHIDAVFVASTRPGRALGDVFDLARSAYAETGYPNEWRLHHQGGPAGYEAREGIGVPGLADTVVVGQTYAWNPSITGAKCEDTILVGEDDNQVLTDIPGWPTIAVSLPGEPRPILRPAILEVI
jgi:Xaa-Pro aminopeptidase